MRRRLLTLILLIACFSTAHARLPMGVLDRDRFRFGVEWGYTQRFYQHRDYNFISEEGYRIFDEYSGFNFSANATVLGVVGYQLTERSNLALCSGYIGIGKNNRLVPVLLRYSFYPSGAWSDGLVAFAQGGTAWHEHENYGRQAWLASAGGGYRIRLGGSCCLDLLLGFKYVYDHPSIPNPEGPGNVPEHNIRGNHARHCALDLSIAISF